jgi:hypothetical protein
MVGKIERAVRARLPAETVALLEPGSAEATPPAGPRPPEAGPALGAVADGGLS